MGRAVWCAMVRDCMPPAVRPGLISNMKRRCGCMRAFKPSQSTGYGNMQRVCDGTNTPGQPKQWLPRHFSGAAIRELACAKGGPASAASPLHRSPHTNHRSQQLAHAALPSASV